MASGNGTLHGKVAIITGGGTGLGRAMARALAEEGADVVVAARRAAPIEETANEVRSIGTRGLAISTDVTDSAQVNGMVDRAMDEMGRIDILINNAGIVRGERPVDVWDITDEMWREGIDVNLTGAFYCSRALGKYFVERRQGKIINVGAGMGFRGIRNNIMYPTAKNGLVALTRALALSWAPFGVQVNCLVPGFVDTAELQPADIKAARAAGGGGRKLFVPVGSPGVPDDIGSLGLFLSSDASDYVTGAVFVSDGGGLAGGLAITGYAPIIELEDELL
jgi:NAD(P)-dependent dehydrogenase (short-subunit alcohol dehydrogenase family)